MKRPLLKILALVARVNKQIADGEVRLLANSLSYSTVLSMIPFFAVSLSVFHVFGGLDKLYAELEPIVMQNLASAAGKSAITAMQDLIVRVKPRTFGLFGFIGLLITSTALLVDMEAAIEKVWAVKEKRSITLRLLFSSAIIFFGPLTLAILVGFMYSDKGGIFYAHKTFFNSVVLWLIVFFIYKFVPSEKVKWWPAIVSAIVASLSLAGGQKVFTFLTKSFFNYNKIYGSLAAIPIFFLWISILWWIFLIGVALCATLCHLSTNSKSQEDLQ